MSQPQKNSTAYIEVLPNDGADFLAESLHVDGATKISKDSEFRDIEWTMCSLVTLPGISSYQKRFSFFNVKGFPGGFSLSLAEFAYARLYNPSDEEEPLAEWLTVHNELTALNQFVEHCYQEGARNFSEVDDRICKSFVNGNQTNAKLQPLSKSRLKTIISVIYKLWGCRARISQPFVSIPFGKSMDKLFGKKKGQVNENKTPVIPVSIYRPLTAAALEYVLKYGESIIGVWQEMLDIWTKEIGVRWRSETTRFKRLQIATTNILSKHDSPWRRTRWKSYGDVYDELNQLRRACMIVILTYSGVRDSELLSACAGCCITDTDENGQLIHFLDTILHKHRRGGVRDTWVIIEEVVKAIRLLEKLTERARTQSGEKHLFISDRTNYLFSVQKKFGPDDLFVLTESSIIYQLNAFVKFQNKVGRENTIPEWVDEKNISKQWHLNARQFRRTLAHHIARQPFGVIAGMLQYKHVEARVFEGYAGIDPEWNKLQEKERVLASVDLLEEVAMDMADGAVAGEFGQKLKDDFEAEFRGRAEDFPASQIAKWLADSRKSLFVGKFNFCFFDPLKALCTKKSNSASRPILNSCDPKHCGNACVTKRHAVMWSSQLAQARELASQRTASPALQKMLQEEVTDLEKVVSSVEGHPDGG